MAGKKVFYSQCKWWTETMDGMGFCKLYSFLCPGDDEACNFILEEEEE